MPLLTYKGLEGSVAESRGVALPMLGYGLAAGESIESAEVSIQRWAGRDRQVLTWGQAREPATGPESHSIGEDGYVEPE